MLPLPSGVSDIDRGGTLPQVSGVGTPDGLVARNSTIDPVTGRVVSRVIAVGLFASSVVAGCNGSTSAPTRAQTHTRTSTPPVTGTSRAWPLWLRPLPRRGVSACQSLQRQSRYVVLCPGKMFVPPSGKGLPLAIRPFPRGLQSSSRRFPHLYEVDFTYGAPSNEVGPASNPHPAQRHTPARFFHLVIGGGVFKLRQVSIEQYIPGVGLTARRLGTVTLGGRRGTLFLGRSWPIGGYLGGHLTFVWRSNGARYFASLHTWVPMKQARKTLGLLVKSFTPADELGSRHRR
jgi:hypothetical protein